MNEMYAVVQLPKHTGDSPIYAGSIKADYYGAYDDAFDCFNELIAEEGSQLRVKKNKQALRVALKNCDVELWIIKRTNELAV